MKYIVVSCGERQIELEAVCNTYAEAYAKMKDCFLDYHRECGHTEKQLEELKLKIETDSEGCYYGFYGDSYGFAWSNVNDYYDYDIKIFVID